MYPQGVCRIRKPAYAGIFPRQAHYIPIVSFGFRILCHNIR